MAFSEKLAERIRRVLSERIDFEERRMFGGLAFMVRGHMCCGVVGDRLMVRVGATAYDEALAEPHASEMDFTGRPMRGLVYVDPPGISTAKTLTAWIERGVRFAESQKPK